VTHTGNTLRRPHRQGSRARTDDASRGGTRHRGRDLWRSRGVVHEPMTCFTVTDYLRPVLHPRSKNGDCPGLCRAAGRLGCAVRRRDCLSSCPPARTSIGRCAAGIGHPPRRRLRRFVVARCRLRRVAGRLLRFDDEVLPTVVHRLRRSRQHEIRNGVATVLAQDRSVAGSLDVFAQATPDGCRAPGVRRPSSRVRAHCSPNTHVSSSTELLAGAVVDHGRDLSGRVCVNFAGVRVSAA
jgi:hypothetical protein